MLRLIEGIPPEDVKRYLPGFDFLDPVSPAAPKSPLPAGINWVYGTFAGWLTDAQSLPVKYEDVVGPRGGGDTERQRETVRKIMEFTGVDTRQVDLQTVVDSLYDEKSPTFRKGRIDSWRDEFDPEFEEVFLRQSKGLLDLYGYIR
jgi:hypothetical protein